MEGSHITVRKKGRECADSLGQHRGTSGGKRMLGLLKRHEVEILLKAGHKRPEVARLTGISPSSVRRIAGEVVPGQNPVQPQNE